MPTNSVKGFKVGNEVKKYDYNELDNLPENNPDDLAEEISDLKSDLSKFHSVVYNDVSLPLTQNASTYVFYPMFAGKTYTIKNTGASGAIAIWTRYTEGGSDVESVGEPTAGRTITFTPSNDTQYLRIFCNAANGSVSIVQSDTLYYDVEALDNRIDSIDEQILMPSQTFSTWEQGTASDATNANRIHIKCGLLEQGFINITNTLSSGRIAVDVFSDSSYTNMISSTGLTAGNFTAQVENGCYVAITGANSSYSAITPNYFGDSANVVYSQYVNDAISYLRTQSYKGAILERSYNDWKQGTASDNQNKNRVSVFIGKCCVGSLKVTTVGGLQYSVSLYDSEYYDNKISDTGWKQTASETPVQDGTFPVVMFSRTNYSAIDSSALDVDGVSVVFSSLMTVQINDNRNNPITSLIEQNGIRESLAVPYYYIAQNYLDGKIARINELAEDVGGNGDSFAFITDVHWKLNAKKSPSLLNYLYHNTHINKLFGGGDYSDAKHSDNTYQTIASIFKDAWHGNRYYAIGNHEYLGSGGVMNTEENLAYYFASYYGNEVVFGSMARNYFYVNNNGAKLRYVFLNRYAESTNGGSASNDGLETEQLTWFENIALNVESGWGIVVVVHSIYGFNIISDNTVSPFISSGSQSLVDILEEYNGNGEIIAVITGHSHMDFVMRLSNDIPVIVTTCDKNKTGGETPIYSDYWNDRQDGTTNEQAFDVFTIDRENRTITAVRIGCPAMTWTQSGDNYVRGANTEERAITY